jgi:hypothetical protein
MNADGKKLLELLFNPGEHVYASPDKYSSKWSDELNDWEFYRPSIRVEDVPLGGTVLIGINPCKPDVPNRADEHVTAYRSFLIEIDDGTLKDQMEYVKASRLPFSACVFSGNKSLHFVVTLDRDLPTEDVYRVYSEWLLRTLPRADQKTKNPSRGIRFAGATRPETGKLQALVGPVNGRVSLNKLMAYLSKHPDKKPEIRPPEDFNAKVHNKDGMGRWVLVGLEKGFDFSKGRNQTWFSVGFEFGKCGYSVEEMIEACEPQYAEDGDFRKREWKAALKNGHKKALKKYWSGK